MFLGLCICILFKFLASVGNARTKKAQPKRGWAAVSKGSWGQLLRSWVTARRITNFSPNYAKIQNSFKQNKFISCLNCLTFHKGVAELSFKICNFALKVSRHKLCTSFRELHVHCKYATSLMVHTEGTCIKAWHPQPWLAESPSWGQMFVAVIVC